ncbi:FlgD immunoglobulin-like domain containing protein [Calditrichota bacterium LG25]
MINKIDPYVDFSNYDHWSGANPGSDGKVDMIFMIYRNFSDSLINSDWTGIAMLSLNSDLNVDGVKIERGYPGSGVQMRGGKYGGTYTKFIAAHEYGHYLFGAGHIYGVTNLALMTGGPVWYGMKGMHSWEREKLGWINFQNLTSDNLITVRDCYQANTIYKIPVTNTEYFLIENRQHNSVNDYSGDRGIYIYHVKSGNYFPPNIDVECADGNWDFSFDTNNKLISRIAPNPNGKDELNIVYYYDLDGDGKNERFACFPPYYPENAAWGDNEDAFDLTFNNIFSPWSNPNSLNSASIDFSIEVLSENNGTFELEVNFSDPVSQSPFRPMNFNVELNNDYIQLSWYPNSEPDFNRYEIYRSYNSTSGFSNIKNIYDINTINYNDQNFQPSTSGFVYYKMRVKDNSSKYSVFTRVKGFDIPPDVPQNFHIVSVSYGVVEHPKLIWNANIENDLSGYKIERRINNGNWQVVHTASPSETYWTDMEISRQKSNNYDNAYYRMRAFDGSNHYSQYTATQTYWFSEGGGPMKEKGKYPVVALPKTEILFNNSPNPFNPTTTIKFGLPEDGYVQLTIYSMNGQKVRTLINGPVSKGYHQIIWDGKNESGQPVSGGLYVYELRTKHKRLLKKMLLVK